MDLLLPLSQGDIGLDQLLLLLLIPGGCLLLLLALLSDGGARPQIERRIARIKRNHEHKAQAASQVRIARDRNRSSEIRALDQLIGRYMPQQQMLRLRLERAGLGISISVYILASLLVGALGLVAAISLWNWPWPAAILFGLAQGLSLPYAFLTMRIKRRQARFIEFFPDAIDLMVRGIRAGLPIVESMRSAGDEVPNPVGQELKRVTDGVRIGRQLDDVLWEASRRLDLQDFNFFTIALSIQSETGGNLAETLNNLSEVLRGRRQLKRKIKALSSEAKASAYIIGSLPFIMTGLIYLVNSGYIVGLFSDPRGQTMIGFGIAMIMAGVGVMYRMVKFEI